MVFGGGILGGMRKIWGNPYLNSTTVLFDTMGWLQNSLILSLKIDSENGETPQKFL